MTATSAVMSVLAVLVLAVAYRGRSGPGSADRLVMATVQASWPRAGAVVSLVDRLAHPGPAAVVVAVLVGGCLVARRWRLAVVAAIGPLGAAATTTVLKPLVSRTIHGDNLAFPSGHTAFATAVAMVLGLFLVGLLRSRRAVGGVVLGSVTLFGGVSMAADQLILDAHYPSDTLGGFFTAIAVVSLVALLTDVLSGVAAGRG